MTEKHSLEIEGHQLVALEYNDHINSTPVIFLHGIANSVDLWEPVQAEYVSDCMHWYSLSLPGHYPACLPDGFKPKNLTPELVADLMSGAIAQLTNGKPVLLVGYSTGGFAALCIAYHAPELVERMLLLDGFARSIWAKEWRFKQITSHVWCIASTIFTPDVRLNFKSPVLMRFLYNLFITDMQASTDCPATDAILESNWETIRTGHPLQLYPYFRHLFHQDIGDWLPDIETDTLILHGDADRILLPEQAKYLHANLKNSRLQWIDGSGHLPFLERPALFKHYLTEWLLEEKSCT